MNYFFLMNNTGTCAWRVHPVMRALEDYGHKCIAINVKNFTEHEWLQITSWADVLTFQMVSARDLVEQARRKGIYTIFDADDLIEEVPPKHPQFKVTKSRRYQEDFKAAMKNVDLITVSSQPLFDRYQQKNPSIRLLPNYLPDEFWEKPYNPNRQTETVRLGWAGGVSHQEDLDFISPVIRSVINKYNNVKFVYTGGGGWNTQNPDAAFRFGKDQFEDIPYSRKEYNVGSRIEMWPDRLNSMRLDIGLAPLDDNNFSRCKTHIKYFEYAINHWPGVYQKFLYGDVVKHGETGFLATTAEEWQHYIELLINDPALRKEMGEKAYQDVKENHTFQIQGEDWVQTYLFAGMQSELGHASAFVTS